jgi:hypothetical protein
MASARSRIEHKHCLVCMRPTERLPAQQDGANSQDRRARRSSIAVTHGGLQTPVKFGLYRRAWSPDSLTAFSG